MRYHVPRAMLATMLAVLLGCSDSSDSNQPAPPPVPDNFNAADASLEDFVATHPGFNGASLVVVDRQRGVVHRHFVGDYTPETVVLLASTSKVPSASLLVALAEDDDNVDFEMDRVIDQYLPWQGVWTGRTAEQLVSNTSGMPGLAHISGYEDHMCQYVPSGQLRECGRTIYQTPLDHLTSYPPGTHFEYGGSQWQLAGALAEVVGGATWNQLFDQYIGEPCELEVFEYGNPLAGFASWTGDPDSLVGRANPNIEGGAITNQSDYAKILLMHLNDGLCGERQVLSAQGAAAMREDRAWATGSVPGESPGYGMGWWVVPADAGMEPNLFIDPGAFGAVAWIDTRRGYGGFMAIQSTTLADGSTAGGYGRGELIPLVQAAYDAARQ
ncbi:MAG: serine hydrolase domain-containing protein [Halioglobus sp.]|nr:serine hydrolase domain-containing protein [Halioglobus sp.]